MELTTLFLYVIAVSAVMVTPGPSMLLALNNGATHGIALPVMVFWVPYWLTCY
ncbi:hypothetical protein ACQ86O_20645 [Serratia sp. L9]|uniref:hypothetical protein n=1 Tax=Serratia sp. L9 TaxID=3423946 RepID=UPI003D672FC8